LKNENVAVVIKIIILIISIVGACGKTTTEPSDNSGNKPKANESEEAVTLEFWVYSEKRTYIGVN
jgi:hypothetical protein